MTAYDTRVEQDVLLVHALCMVFHAALPFASVGAGYRAGCGFMCDAAVLASAAAMGLYCSVLMARQEIVWAGAELRTDCAGSAHFRLVRVSLRPCRICSILSAGFGWTTQARICKVVRNNRPLLLGTHCVLLVALCSMLIDHDQTVAENMHVALLLDQQVSRCQRGLGLPAANATDS